METNRDNGPLFTLVRKVRIFTPEHVETGDILLAGNITSPPAPLSLTETLLTITERHKSLKGVTLSSDENGSLQKFDDQGRFIGMGIGQIDVLGQAIRRLVMEEGVAAETMSGRKPAGE